MIINCFGGYWLRYTFDTINDEWLIDIYHNQALIRIVHDGSTIREPMSLIMRPAGRSSGQIT